MIELAKHIEILLLDNDCVIVPELGGFITHYQPAHYEEAEGMYLPPVRTVGFNPQLTMNDGLLTQSYMQAYHTDFPDAVRKIAEKVESLKETLHREGVAEMPGIGMLHYTIHETYEFHPNENGVLSPSLYALDAFSILPLSAEVEECVRTEEPMRADVLPMKKRKEFRLNPQWLGNAVAVAVAAILFFALSIPVENTYVDKGIYASLGTDCLFDAIRSHSVATTLSVSEVKPQAKRTSTPAPVVVKVEKVAKAENMEPKTEAPKKPEVLTPAPAPKAKAPEVKKAPEAKKSPEVKTKPVAAPKEKAPEKPVVTKKKTHYHIIVASLATRSDAQRMIQEYAAKGYGNASIVEGSGRFRISLYSFEDKSAAQAKINALKQNEAYKSAWMLTTK